MKRVKAMAAGWLCAMLAAGSAGAANVYLLSSDPAGVSSFITTTNWSNFEGPTAANDYWVGGPAQRALRTPDASPAAFTFAGYSLTVTNNGVLRYKGSNSTITINRHTVDGGLLHNGNAGRTWTLRGGITVGPAGCTLMGESTDRTIVIPDPIVGDGGLIVCGPGKMILSANNSYGGGTYVSNGTLQVGNGGASGTWGLGPLTNQGTLAFNIVPGDMTISGPLYPAGTGGVSKVAAGIWTLMETPSAEYAGVTTINSGTLALGADNKLGTGTLDMRNNGTIIRSLDANTRTVTNLLSISANIVFGSADTGELVFQGPVNNGGANKELTISNAVTTFGNFINTGMVTIRGPGIFRLAAGAAMPSSTNIVVAAGGWFDATVAGGFTNPAAKAFAGAGTVLGDFTAYGNVMPGVGGPGTLTLSNHLALSDSTLFLDLTSSALVGQGTNDLLDVTGNVTLSGLNHIRIQPQGSSFAPSYTFIRYGGVLTGDASFFTVDNASDFRQTFTVNTDTAGAVRLLVSSPIGANLTWSGGYGTPWDVRTTYNWNGNSELFYATDAVRFDDTAAVTTVDLIGPLSPSSILVDSTLDYTFQGAGKITGGTALSKIGTSTLAINATNDYSGGTFISNGVVRVGNLAALGGAGGVYVGGTGTLDINGFGLYARPGAYVIIGDGYNAQGAIVNGGAAQNNAIRCLALAGNATIAAPANRWDIRSPTYGLDELNLNGFTLTKKGPGQNSIVQQIMTNSGSLEVTEGNVTFTRSFVGGDGSVNLWPGTILGFENNSTGYFAKAVSATGATIRLIGNSYAMDGPVTLSAFNTVESPTNQTLTWSNRVSGDGALTKVGGGRLLLSASNSYAGATAINLGILQVDGTLSGPGDVTVGVAATLKGTGTVNGAVLVLDEGTLAPGDSAGTLTLNSNLTLNINAVLAFELGAQSDRVVVGGDVQLGGRLQVTDSGGFGPGTYTLIQCAGTMNGSVPTLELTPTTNYTYQLSTATPGQLNLVVGSTSLPPFSQWLINYFADTNSPDAAPHADPDGDRADNEAEFNAGTNPTNNLSVLAMVSVQRSGNNFALKWTAAGIRTNHLQVCTNLLTGAFEAVGDPLIISSPGDVLMNYFDVDAATNPAPRVYRVLVEP